MNTEAVFTDRRKNRPKRKRDPRHCQRCGILMERAGCECDGCRKLRSMADKTRYAVRKELGMCPQCGKREPAPNCKQCRPCLDVAKQRAKALRANVNFRANAPAAKGSPAHPCCLAVGKRRKDGALFRCTLPPGHEGTHAAMVPSGRIVYRWRKDLRANVQVLPANPNDTES